jgi:glucoside 3-dehydrogenase (cytochrome c) hitch-hiker subunit
VKRGGTITRRDVLRLAAAAAAAPLVPRMVAAEAARPLAAGRFFDAAEMALLDELTEMIIPEDEHSGGARAAGVPAYIDGRLGEYDTSISDLREEREKWKAGLALVDAAAREISGTSFLEASPEQRVAALTRLAAAEKDPQTDGERFFVELKHWTTFGYYTSRIGIHQEMEYKGNTLLAEFSGTDPATLPAIRPPQDPKPAKP